VICRIGIYRIYLLDGVILGILQKKMVCGIAFVNKMEYYVYKNILNGRYLKNESTD